MIVFMVGGTTYEEAITVYEMNRNSPGVRVILGGSTVHNTERYCSGILVCEIPRIFERASPSDFRTQGSFIHIVEKFSSATFFHQIASQNLQRKNLGFCETDITFIQQSFFSEGRQD